MNTGLNTKRILCYGDSNTWGYIPSSGKRYPANIRWTGQLQGKLGNDYEIVEEGLNGRTTTLDDPDPQRIGKNGETYLTPCLESQNPIDIIILMLGTNDAKVKFGRTPEQIIAGLEKLVVIIKKFAEDKDNQLPEIIIVSPPDVKEKVEGTKEKYKGGQEKIRALAEGYQKIADRYNAHFLDIASFTEPSKTDGLHLDPESHQKIAEAIFTKIKTLNI